MVKASEGRECRVGRDPDEVDLHVVRQAQRERREAVLEEVAVRRVVGQRPPVFPQEHADEHALLVQRKVFRWASARAAPKRDPVADRICFYLLQEAVWVEDGGGAPDGLVVVRSAHVERHGGPGRDHVSANLQGDIGDPGDGNVRGGVIAHGLADDGVQVRSVGVVVRPGVLVAQHAEDLLTEFSLDPREPCKEVHR